MSKKDVNSLISLTFNRLLTVERRKEVTEQLLDNVYIMMICNVKNYIPLDIYIDRSTNIIQYIIAESFEQAMLEVYTNHTSYNEIEDILTHIRYKYPSFDHVNKEKIMEEIKKLESKFDIYKFVETICTIEYRDAFRKSFDDYMKHVFICKLKTNEIKQIKSYYEVMNFTDEK